MVTTAQTQCSILKAAKEMYHSQFIKFEEHTNQPHGV
jgi:hypothetical protein